MKKSLLVLILSGLTFVSCEKTEQKNQTSSNQNSATSVAKEFSNTDDEMEQRMYFSLLSNSEKIEIARNHFNYCLNNSSKFPLSSAQRTFADNLKNNLKKIFNGVAPKENQFFKQIEKDIAILFPSQEFSLLGYYLFDTMISSDEDFNSVPIPNPNGGIICKCSTTSNWCSSGTSLKIKCSTDLCSQQTFDGCGTLWGYKCDGICNLFSI